MISRRSLVCTGAAALAVTSLPVSGRMHLQERSAGDWPEIRGRGIDREGSFVIPGDGIRFMPGDPVWAATELSFAGYLRAGEWLAMTEGVLLALADAPEFSLVGIDAATGTELWRQPGVTSIVGVADGVVIHTNEGGSGESSFALKAMDVHSTMDLWSVEVGGVAGAVVATAETLVCAETHDDEVRVVARSLSTGDLVWSFDVTEWDKQVPGAFRSNGELVIGSTTISQDFVSAWDVKSGEMLWQFEHASIVEVPHFRGDEVLVYSYDGVHILAADTGNEIDFIETRYLSGGGLWMVNTDEVAVLMSPGELAAYSWETGKELWSRYLMHSRQSTDLFVCDGLFYRVETRDETDPKATTICGYRLTDGRLAFEYEPRHPDGNPVEISAVVVANGTLFVSTDRGVMTAAAGSQPLQLPADPIVDKVFANKEYGFSYSWDEPWVAHGARAMTPNGLSFHGADEMGWVTQYAGPAADSDTDFEERWHGSLGDMSYSITATREMEAPPLDFVPKAATVLGVEYDSTFYQPYTTLYGLRVLVPLRDDNVLAFEYLQGDSRFEETVGAFATFFENLVLPGEESDARWPGDDSHVVPSGSG